MLCGFGGAWGGEGTVIYTVKGMRMGGVDLLGDVDGLGWLLGWKLGSVHY